MKQSFSNLIDSFITHASLMNIWVCSAGDRYMVNFGLLVSSFNNASMDVQSK